MERNRNQGGEILNKERISVLLGGGIFAGNAWDGRANGGHIKGA